MTFRGVVSLLAFAPSTLLSQSLGRQIDRVRDGTVRLTYASRPGLCGDGRETIRTGPAIIVLPNMFGYGTSNMDVCFSGPVRVAIARSNGETISYRVHVGGRWNAGDDATDLGVVSASEAARYLIEAATTANARNSVYALAAAVFADSIDLVPDLARIARNEQLRQELRQRAVFWIGTYDGEIASRRLRELASDNRLDDAIRGSAIIALGRDDISDEDVAWLQSLYPNVSEKLRDNIFLAVSRSDGPRASRWLSSVVTDDRESEHAREQAMFWLGQGRSPTEDLVRLYDRLSTASLRKHYTFVLSQRRDRAALDKLIDVAEHDTDRDVRHQALFWLGQSKDPRALAYIRELVTR